MSERVRVSREDTPIGVRGRERREEFFSRGEDIHIDKEGEHYRVEDRDYRVPTSRETGEVNVYRADEDGRRTEDRPVHQQKKYSDRDNPDADDVIDEVSRRDDL